MVKLFKIVILVFLFCSFIVSGKGNFSLDSISGVYHGIIKSGDAFIDKPIWRNDGKISYLDSERDTINNIFEFYLFFYNSQQSYFLIRKEPDTNFYKLRGLTTIDFDKKNLKPDFN